MISESEGHVLELANELDALLAGQVTPQQFEDWYQAKYQAGVVPHDILDLIASVSHYLSDADIRARDAGYRQMQEQEMRRLIEALRSGKRDVATRISFLGSSR